MDTSAHRGEQNDGTFVVRPRWWRGVDPGWLERDATAVVQATSPASDPRVRLVAGSARRPPAAAAWPLVAPGLAPTRPADLSTFELRWQARIVDGDGTTAAGHFAQVVEQMVRGGRIENAAHDFEPGRMIVTFTFQVKGVASAAVAVGVALREVDIAFANATVGTPYPPPGHAVTQVAVVREARPLSVRFVAA